MLSSIHHAQAKRPGAARLLASTMLSAVLVPVLFGLSPAEARDDGAPVWKFGDTVLSDSDDNVTNSKTLDLTEDVNFGDGTDILTNTGVITIGAKAASPTLVTFKSLETLKNGGLIDLRNGHGGDVLTLSASYNGATGARLGLDVLPGAVDRLVVGRIASGSTAIVLGGLTSKTAVLTGDKGPVLIQAGVDSTATAFRIENSDIGLIHYSMAYNSGDYSFRLVGEAGDRVFDALKISEGAADVWRQSADAWSAHLTSLRAGGYATKGPGVWAQAFGQTQDRDDTIDAAGGREVATDYRQTTFGGQMGADLINGDLGEGHLVLGLTGGYANAKMRFTGADLDARLSVVNVGGYLALSRGGYFLNALAKADRQSVKANGDAGALAAKFDGTAYGGKIEAGARFEGEGMAYEHLVSIDYVGSRLDDMAVGDQRLDFGRATGFVAKAGVRGSVQAEAFQGAFSTYGSAFIVHDFTVKNSLDFVSGGQTEHLSRDGGKTYGELTVGASIRAGEASVTFVEATGDYGGGRRGGGLRIGGRIGF